VEDLEFCDWVDCPTLPIIYPAYSHVTTIARIILGLDMDNLENGTNKTHGLTSIRSGELGSS